MPNYTTQDQAMEAIIQEGKHSSNPQEELIWTEVEAIYNNKHSLIATSNAIQDLMKACAMAAFKVARVQRGIYLP